MEQQSAIICHSVDDTALACDIAAYLESNCALTVSREEISGIGSPDLFDALEIGLSADIVLAALSPASAPNQWKRERWEPLFLRQPGVLGTRLACLLLRPCRFPELFRRGSFFDLSVDALGGMRALKRWAFGQSPVNQTPTHAEATGRFEALRRRIADHPGIEAGLEIEEAMAFCQECSKDFEGVFQIDCARRTRTGILGDVAHALGLRLPGSAELNRTTLARFCAKQRCLFVFDHLAEEDRELVDFGGKTSILITRSDFTQSDAPDRRSLDELEGLFALWPRHPDECLRALGDVVSWLREGEHRASLQLGFATLALLKNFDRLAEACEILDLMASATRAAGDPLTAHRLLWEQSTIRQSWGETVPLPEPVALPEATQLVLEFG